SSRDQLRHFFSRSSVVLQSLTEEQLKNGLTCPLHAAYMMCPKTDSNRRLRKKSNFAVIVRNGA
ncbi:MAG: hypothetical protein IJ761_07995, partial [Bacteroidales bacterium]|nr:hypothetical protein [Bacteroidales bacterium]